MQSANPEYETKVVPAEEAVARIGRGQRVFVGSVAGEPAHLLRTLAARGADLADVELVQFDPIGERTYLSPELRDRIRANAFFVSESLRAAVADCRADYTPAHLSKVPEMFRGGQIPLDVALIMVSPPDAHGYVSLGVSVDITRAAVETAKLVIAQVNPRMPRTLGGALMHVRNVDLFVEHEEELPEVKLADPEEGHRRIAANISRLIPDGATIQVGAGRIPNAVIRYLDDKKDLGIHTEVFSDGLMELVKRGVVTGAKKTFRPGKIISSIVVGTRELYDFVDHNPALELHPSDYVNSALSIAKNANMCAINSGLEVDLTGQVCADSLGFRFYSGLGGHADFTRGASMAPGGKPIIALPSRAITPDGPVSRIVPALKEGAGVLTTRGDIHYVVTEHGIAHLHGKSMRQRAMALIGVAHPEFRQDLLHAAKARRLVFANQIVPAPGAIYPEELETRAEVSDGPSVLLRPVKPSDEEAMKDLFYSFSEQTRYLRFHSAVKEMPHNRLQLFCNVDYNAEMALVAVEEVEGREDRLLGIGRYLMDEGVRTAEVAFVIRDDWQGRGLGRKIFYELARIAKTKDINRFTAEVLVENQAMLSVFRSGGFPMKTNRKAGLIHVEIDLTEV